MIEIASNLPHNNNYQIASTNNSNNEVPIMKFSSVWQTTKNAVTSPEGRHTIEQSLFAGGLMFALAATRVINNPHHWVDSNKAPINALINGVFTTLAVGVLKPIAIGAEVLAIRVCEGVNNFWQKRSHFRGKPHTASEATPLNPGSSAATEQGLAGSMPGPNHSAV